MILVKNKLQATWYASFAKREFKPGPFSQFYTLWPRHRWYETIQNCTACIVRVVYIAMHMNIYQTLKMNSKYLNKTYT